MSAVSASTPDPTLASGGGYATTSSGGFGSEGADSKRDFSNPMYDAMGDMESEAEAQAANSSAVLQLGGVTTADSSSDPSSIPGPFFEPPSAVMASSAGATQPPNTIKKPKEVGPSKVDTGKDTQCLVEEDDDEEEDEDHSEC